MTSPSGKKTSLDASKNKDENSQDGSGQDSDVGSAEKTQKSGKFSEWQKGIKLTVSLNISFNSRYNVLNKLTARRISKMRV